MGKIREVEDTKVMIQVNLVQQLSEKGRPFAVKGDYFFFFSN